MTAVYVRASLVEHQGFCARHYCFTCYLGSVLFGVCLAGKQVSK